jgi:exodeoxyribonuclease-3
VKVITWNVNGIRARQGELAALIAAETPDVICLQEIKAPAAKVPELLVAASGYWCYWHGESAYSGVAVLMRQGFCASAPGFLHPAFDVEQRVVVADLGALRVASVYVPNGGRDYPGKLRFLEHLAVWCRETLAPGRALLVCGDLNVAREERDIHPKERKPNQIGARPEERELFARLLESGLVDVARWLDPDNDQLFTWWAPWRNLRQRNIGWRIDYILADALQAPRARRIVSLREFGTSDHAPLVAVFES